MAASERIAVGDALREIGLDAVAVAKKLRRLLNARAVRYNPGCKRFESFDDGDVQLRTVQEIAKLLDLYPAPKTDDDTRPVIVQFPIGGFSALLAVHDEHDNGGRSGSQLPDCTQRPGDGV
jgi:hypothetical protein